jgi:uncharacterized membrane protein YphA (DoxX/SURF4 family)
MSMITSTGEFHAVAHQPSLRERYDHVEAAAAAFLARHSLTILRVCMGVVYVWFGALKAVHGLSPIEDFIRTALPFLPGDLFLPFLAVWEVVIGLGFISGKFTRVTVALMLAQMGGAMSPLVLRPDLVFAHFPYAWTLVGQYIFKDIILVSASLVILTTARGGGLVSHKEALQQDRKMQ